MPQVLAGRAGDSSGLDRPAFLAIERVDLDPVLDGMRLDDSKADCLVTYRAPIRDSGPRALIDSIQTHTPSPSPDVFRCETTDISVESDQGVGKGPSALRWRLGYHQLTPGHGCESDQY